LNNVVEDKLVQDLSRFYYDPVGYVYWCFPWDEGILSGFKGLRRWQHKYLEELAEQVLERSFDGVNPVKPIQKSVSSGHGIGKSALTAWIIKWIMDTRPFAKGVVTANTGEQLKTKTWAELGKWHKISLTKDRFVHNNTKGNMTFYSKEYPESWRCDAMTCREEQSEAFAGLHSANSTPFYIFDEASAVPEKIYEVAQGGLTDGEPMFLLFGNPTRNTGFFRQTFARQKHRWQHVKIDAEFVEGTNKELQSEWREDYGYDSDFYRVRVRGEFPRSSISQLIPEDLIDAAMGKHLQPHQYNFAAKVLGVDVAWMGDDRSAIFLRQGLMSSLLWQGREVDSIDLANIVAQLEDKHNTDATFVDAGMGNGVIDQLNALGRSPIPVWFGGVSTRPDCYNKRSEMWQYVKEWLKLGAALPYDLDIKDDLVAVEYFVTNNSQIQLVAKKDMKKLGLLSPDLGDALALTFAAPVTKKKAIERFDTGDVSKAQVGKNPLQRRR
jgi:hypothetical protein